MTIHAPFTLSMQLLGEEMALLDLAANPERYRTFVDLIARWSSCAAAHFVEVGADAIMLVDGEADDGILGPELYESFAFPGQKKVVDAAREAGAPTILHICGDIGLSTDLMVRTGVDAISVGQGTSLTRTREIIKGRCRIVGNIDPVSMLLNGNPAQVREDVGRCIGEGSDIAAPGCGLSPLTPVANLQAMTDAIHRWGAGSSRR